MTLMIRVVITHEEVLSSTDCCSLMLLDSIPIPPLSIDLQLESNSMQLLDILPIASEEMSSLTEQSRLDLVVSVTVESLIFEYLEEYSTIALTKPVECHLIDATIETWRLDLIELVQVDCSEMLCTIESFAFKLEVQV